MSHIRKQFTFAALKGRDTKVSVFIENASKIMSRNPYLIMQQSYKKYFAVSLRYMNRKCPREKPPLCL